LRFVLISPLVPNQSLQLKYTTRKKWHINKASKFRWIIILLLFAMTATNYVDRSTISYAITEIAQQFQLDDDAVGLILGAFGVGHLVTTFVSGITVDHQGPKSTMFIAVAIWSLATSLPGYQPQH
jgi:MFS transporter, ACS family, hexuronate transporter